MLCGYRAEWITSSAVNEIRARGISYVERQHFVTHDVTRTEQQKGEAIEILCRVLDAIRSGISWPNRGWQCRNCEYRRRCGGAA